MSSLWTNLFRRREATDDMYKLLQKVPIFAELSRREADALERILYRRSYQADEVIFQQNEPGVGMYIIAHGHVRITYGPNGVPLADLEAGDFFGEIALLNETPRSATARALTATELYGFFRPDLLNLLERNPSLGVKVLLPLAQITGQRLIHADAECARLRSAADEATSLPQPEPRHGDGR